MGGEASCPRCDSPVPIVQAVCPCCGFVLIEDSTAGGGRRRLARGPRRRRSGPPLAPLLAAAALITAAAVGLVFFEAPAAPGPSSDALPAAQAERRLAARFPHLRDTEHAVIACPDRAIQPGGQARCWILARVGLQRSVTVRLSLRGNRVEIED
jgi:hypothetical protein